MNPLYAPINADLTPGQKVTIPWRNFFQALNQNIAPTIGAITGLTGDVTATGPGVVAATLVNTAVTPGSYGSATQVGTFTVDGKGRLTAAANMAITATGTVTHTAGALTANQVVIGNGAADLKTLGSFGTAGQVLGSQGSSAPAWQDTFPLHFVFKSNLTNAQFLTLPSAYIELVPAGGANVIHIPLWAFIHVDATAGAYTNVDPGPEAGLTIAYGDWDSDCFCFMPFAGTTTRTVLFPMMRVPDATVLLSAYPDITLNFAPAATALKLVAWNDSGDYTGGHASNTFRIGVTYCSINYVTGLFS